MSVCESDPSMAGVCLSAVVTGLHMHSLLLPCAGSLLDDLIGDRAAGRWTRLKRMGCGQLSVFDWPNRLPSKVFEVSGLETLPTLAEADTASQ